MQKTYQEQPEIVEVIPFASDTSHITMRNNIEHIENEWICDERTYFYPAILSPTDIISQFNYWWEFGMSLDEIRISKINALSKLCESTIISGFNVRLSDGNVYRFDFDLEAQSNITGLVLQVSAGMNECDYYDCNGNCLTLNATDITLLNQHALAHKSYHIAYYHCLCDWINDLADVNEIWNIQYGDLIPDEYQNSYLKKWAMLTETITDTESEENNE